MHLFRRFKMLGSGLGALVSAVAFIMGFMTTPARAATVTCSTGACTYIDPDSGATGGGTCGATTNHQACICSYDGAYNAQAACTAH